MHEDTVWAFEPIDELNGETGFVACDAELAQKLIEAEKVQDPRVGALHLKEIQAGDYNTKQVTAKKTVRKRRTKKATDEEE
jgi:hypothetical protein